MNVPHDHISTSLDYHRRLTADGVKVWGDPTVVYEFLMEHGQEFTGREKPKGYVYRQPRMCFANAFALALKSRHMTYVEGYAYSGLIPVHHAWCIDPEGQVVENTWRHGDPTEWEYFGVALDAVALQSWMRQKPTASVLYDLHYNQDFIAPGLTAEEILARVAA